MRLLRFPLKARALGLRAGSVWRVRRCLGGRSFPEGNDRRWMRGTAEPAVTVAHVCRAQARGGQFSVGPAGHLAAEERLRWAAEPAPGDTGLRHRV